MSNVCSFICISISCCRGLQTPRNAVELHDKIYECDREDDCKMKITQQRNQRTEKSHSFQCTQLQRVEMPSLYNYHAVTPDFSQRFRIRTSKKLSTSRSKSTHKAVASGMVSSTVELHTNQLLCGIVLIMKLFWQRTSRNHDLD